MADEAIYRCVECSTAFNSWGTCPNCAAQHSTGEVVYLSDGGAMIPTMGPPAEVIEALREAITSGAVTGWKAARIKAWSDWAEAFDDTDYPTRIMEAE